MKTRATKTETPASDSWCDPSENRDTGGRNPSPNICLISAGTWGTAEGGAGFISNVVAARLVAQLAWQPSGVIDDTNSKSY